ncbi:MAG: nucleoside kinase [Spirochaetia bacterium]|nr:nucleoside kinase [Spirochaetia bacterium]
MSDLLKEITVSDINGNSKKFTLGIKAIDAAKGLNIIDKDRTLVGIKINNIPGGIHYRLIVNSVVEPIYLDSKIGSDIYRHTFCFILAMVAKEVFPDRKLIVGNTIGDCYTFYFEHIMDVSADDLSLLDEKFSEIVEKDEPIIQSQLAYSEAEELFRTQKIDGAAMLLQYTNSPIIRISKCRNYSDLAHGPMIPSTKYLSHYKFMCYNIGFLVQFPKEGTIDKIPIFKDIPVLTSIFKEYRMRATLQNFSNVGELNAHIAAGHERDIILMSEVLQTKKIAIIAEEIYSRKGTVKVIMIAGPSSSGKTTFIKRLSTQLQILGFKPQQLSLDDYFVPKLETPKDENGNYDFECIEAIDIELLNKDLNNFFKGKEINIPTYNFITGLREYKGTRLKAEPNSILLVEGIHGLNDKLTYNIPKENKFKIYISALTQLNLDDHNRIHTTDNRLIRRLVRDYKTRGNSATTTLSMWEAVRKGEDKNIFPFQSNADMAFNSALDYELAILGPIATPLLMSVKPDQPEYMTARRLQYLLKNFLRMPSILVPFDSILREFLGYSIYDVNLRK